MGSAGRIALLVVVAALAAGTWLWLDDGPVEETRAPSAREAAPASGVVAPGALPRGEASEARPLQAETAEQSAPTEADRASARDAVQQVLGGAPAADDRPRAVLLGRVVGPDGRPVPEAEVAFVDGPLPQVGALALVAAEVEGVDASELRLGRDRTTTDDEGRFRLDTTLPAPDTGDAEHPAFLDDVLEAGARLLVEHPGFVAGSHELPALVEGEQDVGVVVLDPAGWISGRVVDADGRPVPGARVGVRAARDTESLDLGGLLESVLGSMEEALSRGESGPDGRFVLGGLSPGRVRLVVATDHHPLLSLPDLLVEAGRETRLDDLALERGFAVSGVVLDRADGAPLAGVEVRIAPQSGGLEGLEDLSSRLLVGGLQRKTTTDADGRFRFDGVREGGHELRAGDDGWSVTERAVSAGARDVVLRVGRLGELLVRVLDPVGEPVRRFELDAEADDGPRPDLVDGDELVERAQAEAERPSPLPGPALPAELDGFVLVLGAGASDVRLSVAADGFATRTHVARGEETARRRLVELTLTPEARLAGVVVDEDGEPVADARVSAREEGAEDEDGPTFSGDGLGLSASFSANVSVSEPGEDEAEARKTRTRSDEAGRFELTGLDAGRWLVSATAEGMLDGDEQLVELEAAQQRDGLVLVLQPGGTVAGHVREADGRPVADATLSLVPQGGGGGALDLMNPDALKSNVERSLSLTLTGASGDARQVESEADGSYRMTGVRPGLYELSLKRDAMGPLGLDIGGLLGGAPPVDGERTHRVEVVARETTVVDFVREPRAAVEVEVLAGGGVARDARISLTDASQSFLGVELALGGRTRDADDRGRARYDDLEPGRYKITAAVPGAPRLQETRVELAAGDVERVVLRFADTSLRGRVLDATTGEPAAGVVVALVEAEEAEEAEPSGGFFGGGNVSFSMDVQGAGPAGGPQGLLGLAADRVTTDGDGRFVLRHVDPGRWQVTAGGEGPWLEDTSSPVTVEEGADAPELTLRVARGATIEGLALEGSSEEPLDGVQIQLLPQGAGERRETDARLGRYLFEGVAPGDYLLVVDGEDGPRAERRVQVSEPGQRLDVPLVTLD